MDFDWASLEEKFQGDFAGVVDRLEKNYKKLYTSRVSPDLVSDVYVNAYGSEMKIQETANFQVSAARTLVIKPYDVSIMDEIVKGLQKYHPEFSPIVQSDHIKIILNPPTEESRKKAVKEAKEYLEQAKIGVRNIRKECMDKLKKDDQIPEDQEKKYINQIDVEIKKMNGKLEAIFSAKEKDLMTI
ncbi:ribosome-recycling factor [Candidatus Mycoplasma haematohominis]|uniref:ribosome-recycling factor n=1 Tax=Candidatus Mycoplasma haematohominis TaxID=1494318 RepID=UPI001FE8C608|nr:ribosome-recycling factor [Candidatus Mycoplasma haemohominis]